MGACLEALFSKNDRTDKNNNELVLEELLQTI